MIPNAFSADLLNLVFKGTAIANIADNAASSPLTSLEAALHAAFPGYGGDQTSSEISYTGYQRKPVTRGAGFTVSGQGVALTSTLSFDLCTGGSATAMFATIGTAHSGGGKILAMCPLGVPLGPFTALSAGDLFTLPGLTGLNVDDRICFLAPHTGMTLPGGVTEGVVYFVKSVSGNDITVSTTQGGATLDVTSAGDGLAFKITPIPISNNTTPQLIGSQQFLVLR